LLRTSCFKNPGFEALFCRKPLEVTFETMLMLIPD
jgi:hypothetical protein